MAIKEIKRKVVSSPGGFKMWKIMYMDTESGRTWWDWGGDISKKSSDKDPEAPYSDPLPGAPPGQNIAKKKRNKLKVTT